MNKEMYKTKSKTGRYLIIAAVVLVVLVLLVIQSCTIRTPEIHGVVLDAETKQPVAEAWIRASIGTKSLTIQGDVGGVISLAPPHLRTGEDGTFVIPSRKIRKTPFPLAFGTEVSDLSVSARTLDKSGSKRSDKPIGSWNRKMDVTIYLEDREAFERKTYTTDMTEERWKEEFERSEFASLQGLYRYCQFGRAGIESNLGKPEGCDDWELDFAIKKHERFLERYPLTKEIRSHRSIILEQLGHLYKKKQDYKKAIEYLEKAKEIRFFRQQDLEAEIQQIKQLLK